MGPPRRRSFEALRSARQFGLEVASGAAAAARGRLIAHRARLHHLPIDLIQRGLELPRVDVHNLHEAFRLHLRCQSSLGWADHQGGCRSRDVQALPRPVPPVAVARLVVVL